MPANDRLREPITIRLTVDIIYNQGEVDAFRAAVAPSFQVVGGIISPPMIDGRVAPRRHTPTLQVVVEFLQDQLPNLADSAAVAVLGAGFNYLRQRRFQKSGQPPPLPPITFDVVDETETGERRHSHAELYTQDEKLLALAIRALTRFPQSSSPSRQEPRAAPRFEYDPITDAWSEKQY